MGLFKRQKPILIAISGGSGSGKTTLGRMLKKSLEKKLGVAHVSILAQDNYYIDQSHRFDGDGGTVNFDHPSAIDFDLIKKHLHELKRGKSVRVPLYDFVTHKRKDKTECFEPTPIVLVDGTLLLSQEPLLDCFDYKIFIDIPEDVRFERRLKRDTLERGREPEGVKKQFLSQVKPMHDQFVQPSSHNADLIVKDLNFDEELATKIAEKITALL